MAARHRIYWAVYVLILLAASAVCLEIGARIIIAVQGQEKYDDRLAKMDKEVTRIQQVRSFTPIFASNAYWGYGYAKGVTSLDNLRSQGAPYHYPLSEEEFAWRVDGLPANNWGFQADRDYPYNRSDAYIVGIFGGSVANFFHAMMRYDLERELSILLHRNVVILNFALGAGKQPQQVQILTFFSTIGQQLDLVLNIDGFNEVTQTGQNAQDKVTTAIPAYNIIGALRPDQRIASQLADYAAQSANLGAFVEAMQRFVRWNQRTLGSRFLHLCAATASSFAEGRLAGMRTEITQQAKSNPGSASAIVPPFSPLFGSDDPVEQGIRTWMESTRIMARLARAAGAEYFEFLQPSQYLTQRKFTEQERTIAIQPGQEGTSHPYQRLVSRIGELASGGIKVYSLTDIFENVQGPIFVDDCCHFNLRGNQLMADAIIARLRAELGHSR